MVYFFTWLGLRTLALILGGALFLLALLFLNDR